MPFLHFRRDHFRFGVICDPSWGSFAGLFGVGKCSVPGASFSKVTPEKFSHPESHIKISNLFYLLRVSNFMITGLFLFTFFTKTEVINHFIQEVSDVYSSVFLYTDKLKNGGHKFLGSGTKSWASTSAEGG